MHLLRVSTIVDVAVYTILFGCPVGEDALAIGMSSSVKTSRLLTFTSSETFMTDTAYYAYSYAWPDLHRIIFPLESDFICFDNYRGAHVQDFTWPGRSSGVIM